MADEPLKILAIDDHSDNLVTLEAVIQDVIPGTTVITALNGPDGLTLARSEDPDVILLDILMPRMDGFAVCQALKADEKTRLIPVVFLTALQGDRNNRLKALDAGADGFLTKPIDEAELLVQIAAMRKIKAMHVMQHREKETLSAAVENRTAALEGELAERRRAEEALRTAQDRLQHSQAAMLNLLEDLKAENEARKRNEAALQNRENTLNQIFDLLPVGLWFADKNGTLLRGNPAGVKIWGAEPRVSPDEYGVFKAYRLPSHEEIAPEDWALAHTIREGKTVVDELLEIDAFDGKKRIILNFTAPVLDEAGTIQGAIVLNQDITRRQQAEDDLRASEERYRMISTVASDYMFYSHLQPDGRLGLDWAAGAFERMTGYTMAEYIAAGGWRAHVHPDDLAVDDHDLAQLRENQPVVTELRTLRKDGSILWVQVSATPVLDEDSGELLGIYGAVRDISERKQAEQRQKGHIQRMESLTRILQHPVGELRDFLDYSLNEAIRLTESRIGYIYFYDEDTREFELNTWSSKVMAEWEGAESQMFSRLEQMDIWKEAVRQRKAILVNDFQAPHPLKRGMPEGHVSLVRFLTVPVFSNERIVAVVGVANKATDYDHSDELQLGLLMDAVWKVVERNRARDALQALNQRMAHYVDASPVVLFAFEFTADGIRLNWVSDNTERLLGFTLEEMRGKRWWRSHVLDENAIDLDVIESWQDATRSRLTQEYRFARKDGSVVWVQEDIHVLRNAEGRPQEVISAWTDITERKQMETALQSRLVALTRPVEQTGEISFEDLFDLEAIQQLQDEFAAATGVASVITLPDGTPITRPSNFCRLCLDVVRETELGRHNCFKSDAALGRYHQNGPTIQPCLSCGLWDAGASINVGGHHIANWLVGQVRDERQTIENIRAYARLIGADETEAAEAFSEVPFMPQEQFRQVAQMVFTLATQLSNMAYQNIQQARFITERQQAEVQLTASMTTLEAALASMSDAVFISDATGRFTHFNEAFATFHKFDSKAECAETLPEWTAWIEVFTLEGERLPLEQWAVSRALRGETVTGLELILKRKDTGQAWYGSYNFAPIRGAEGEIAGSVVTARDITQRKLSEAALRESEERYRTVVSSAAEAFILQERSGAIVTWNAAAERIFGLTEAEALGQSSTSRRWEVYREDGSFLPGEEHPSMRTFATGEPCRNELVKVVREDESFSWATISTNPVFFGGDGTSPDAVVITVQDITEQRHQEQALRESETRFRTLYEHSPGPYQSLSEEGMILEVNNAWLAALGYPRQAVIGHYFGDFLAEADAELFPQRFAYFKQTGEVHGVEFTMLRRDHSTIEVSFDGHIVRDAQGKFVQTHCVFTNVTEQKRTETTLRQYMADLNKAQAVAHVGSWKWTIPTNALWWSDEMYAIFGIAREDFTGDLADVMTTAIHPDDRPAVEASNRSVMEEGRPIPLEYRVIHPDGTIRTVWAEAGELVLDDAGNPLELTGIVQDITERKAAEASLRESEEKFGLAFENAPYAITITDPSDGQFVDVNRAFSTITGYSHTEALNSTSIGLDVWANRPDRTDVLRQLFAGGEVTEKEFLFRRKDQSLMTGLFSAVVIRLNDQPYILSIINDITAQKQAQAQLQLQDSALQAAANAIVITDLDATIQWANPAFSTLTGYSLEDAMGKNPRDLVQSGLVEKAAYEEMWTTILGGKEWRGEFINRRKDGSLYDEAMSITPIFDADGRVTNFIAIKEDITSRKRQEQRLLTQAHVQERLVAMGRALGATMDINIIYRIAYRYVREIMDVPSMGIALYDPDQQHLEMVFEVGNRNVLDVRSLLDFYHHFDPDNDFREDIGFSQPVIRNDLAEAIDASGAVLVGDAVPQSAIFVPLSAEGRSIGILDLQSDQKDAFTPEIGEWLSVVANQVALAIQNARLYEQVRKRVAQLNGLREIDTAINAHQPLERIYDLVLNQARYHLNADAADILLLDAEGEELIYQAGYGFKSISAQAVKIPYGCGLAGMVVKTGKMIQHMGSDEYDTVLAECEKWMHEDFLSYVGVPVRIGSNVSGVLEIFNRKMISPTPDWLQYLETLAGQIAIAIDNTELFTNLAATAEELLQAYDATIEGWSQAMDLRDRETEGHTQRVMELTLKLATAAGIPERERVHLRRGALLHDMGKLGIPDSILLKPGPLNDEEWALMQQHPRMAYEMLKNVEYLKPALDIPLYHHEKWDGSGYPAGLRGDAIPLAARIFAIVDVWDAVTNERPYKEAWPAEVAKAHLRQQSGSHFDPALVTLFIRIVEEEEE